MTAPGSAETPPVRRRWWQRLYYGETSYEFIGRKRTWFAVSGLIILAGMVALGVRGLNFGIDFRGGTSWEIPAHGATIAQAQSAVAEAGVSNATVQLLTPHGRPATLQVQANVKGAGGGANSAVERKVTDALAKLTHSSTNDVTVNDVGPSWGADVSHKAEIALGVFVGLIILYLSLRFEWKMAVAAIAAVAHDVLVVVGVYAIFGLGVSPDTVVAVLTILGYSLYDTVVVFDKVQENSDLAVSGRYTYSDVVNLSMNQVLMRSINTSLVAVIPIVSVLLIGAYALGATTLEDFGLALFIGLVSGAYSSIFIASPLLALMKEREPRYAQIRARLGARSAPGVLTPAAVAAGAVDVRGRSGGGGGGGILRPTGTKPAEPGAAGATRTANRPAPRPRKKRRR